MWKVLLLKLPPYPAQLSHRVWSYPIHNQLSNEQLCRRCLTILSHKFASVRLVVSNCIQPQSVQLTSIPWSGSFFQLTLSSTTSPIFPWRPRIIWHVYLLSYLADFGEGSQVVCSSSNPSAGMCRFVPLWSTSISSTFSVRSDYWILEYMTYCTWHDTFWGCNKTDILSHEIVKRSYFITVVSRYLEKMTGFKNMSSLHSDKMSVNIQVLNWDGVAISIVSK